MSTVNDRMKAARKALKLIQDDFGKKLGVSGPAISNIESGERNVTEQMILAVCREFGISYEWLKHGTGEMFKKTDDLNAFIGRILAGENETAKAVFRAFAKLDESDWKTIEKLIDLLLKEK